MGVDPSFDYSCLEDSFVRKALVFVVSFSLLNAVSMKYLVLCNQIESICTSRIGSDGSDTTIFNHGIELGRKEVVRNNIPTSQ